MENIAVIVVSVFVSIALYVITIIKTLSWVMDRVDVRIIEKLKMSSEIDEKIDDRIERHPIIKQYILMNYKLDELEKESKEIKQIVQKIDLAMERNKKDGQADNY